MALVCNDYLQIEQGEDATSRIYEPGVPTNYLTCRHALSVVATEDPLELSSVATPALGPSTVTETVTVDGIEQFQPAWTPAQTAALKVGDYDWVIELKGTVDVTQALTRRRTVRLVVKPAGIAAA